MATHILASAEVGNGMAYVVAKRGKTFKSFNVPSFRAKTSGATMGKGMEHAESKIETAKWNGILWAVGDDTIKHRLKGVERHMGDARYGGDLEQFFTAYGLVKSEAVKNGDVVDLVVFVPPGLYRNLSAHMVKAYKGERTIQINRGKPVTFSYNRVIVLPEGYASALCYTHKIDGTPAGNDLLNGDIVFIDAGLKTLDKGHLINGVINPDDLGNATNSEGGALYHVLEPIVNVLKRKFPSCESFMNEFFVDRAIRHGAVTGDYRIKVGVDANTSDNHVDFKDLLDSVNRTYADWIADQIDSAYNSFAGYDRAIATGGGMYGAFPFLDKMYTHGNGFHHFYSPKDVVAKINKQRVGYECQNGAGGLIFLQMVPVTS